MDFFAQDRAALNANLCPDCGGRISRAKIGPWCRSCDVWFEFNSGWVIRNRDAATNVMPDEGYPVAPAAPAETQEAYRESKVKHISDEEITDPGQSADRGDGRFVPRGFDPHLPRYAALPVSLYRWLL